MCTLAVIALSIFHPGYFLAMKERVQVVNESYFAQMREATRKGRPCQMCGRPSGN